MDLQNDELATRILEVAKKFDETAHSKPWKNPKKQRAVADLHYGEKSPGKAYRSEIRCAKKNIYWYIGVHTSLYRKYRTLIEKYEDKEWYEKWGEEETRMVFDEEEKFFEFSDACFGKTVDNSDINTPLPPKGMSADGFVVICPRCETKFKRADRCPDCGQLIKY
ncbi:hypothetical protein [Butyrivibrio sp. VCD2006]|uniref:hypothetical protein n=1 Tax=Butyrivibrio sp. VCD2006 TaxID=1280664 RepID=UPI00040E4EEB|nr:hypothetical protein [Butyrivibrio sp. VCD2006]